MVEDIALPPQSLARQVIDLIIPPCCALCSAEGSSLCEACLGTFEPEPHPFERHGLRGMAVSEYGDFERGLITSFKERGNHNLADFMSHGMAVLLGDELRASVSEIDTGEPQGRTVNSSGRALLVPMPSSRSATKVRGFQPARLIAVRLAFHLNRLGSPGCGATPLRFEVAPLLRLASSGPDQSELGREERFANLRMQLVNRDLRPSSEPAILVDDLVTTGATILTARQTLTSAGFRVVTFCSFAETLLRNENVGRLKR